MSSEKQVLVQLGSYNRVVTLDCGSLSGATEREAILASIRSAFSIEQNDTVTLQVKDESWGGAFVDYFKDCVPDKTVFQVVVDKPQAGFVVYYA